LGKSSDEERQGHVQGVAMPKSPPVEMFDPRQILDLACSRDGKTLISTSGGTGRVADDHIVVWDLATRKRTRELSGQLAPAGCLALSPDGKTLAASCFSTILLWDLSTGKLQEPVAAPQGRLFTARFSPDG